MFSWRLSRIQWYFYYICVHYLLSGTLFLFYHSQFHQSGAHLPFSNSPLTSTLLSPFQLTGRPQITNHPSLQRLWSRPRSRSPLLGKAGQVASHQRGQTSLLLPRQASSKSIMCLFNLSVQHLFIQPLCPSI